MSSHGSTTSAARPYRNIVDRLFGGARALQFEQLESAPFLPVSLFKTHELRSVPPRRGGQDANLERDHRASREPDLPRRRHLATADATLVKIMQHFLGVERRR